MEDRTAISNERALVLGGGGGTGNAWLIGVIAGLFDTGLDVTQADLIIGTSAGSTVAAQITSGIKPTELFANIVDNPPKPGAGPVNSGQAGGANKHHNLLEITNAIIGSAENPKDMCRKIGAALLEMDSAFDDSRHVQWRNTVGNRLPGQHWPQQAMLITAVNANTGESVIFDRSSGIDLVDAVAASTSGGFAYRIGNNRYIDGGYRTDVNADLAAGYRRVLIIPPLGDKTRKRLEWGLHLAAQVEELRAQGTKVKTILPDSDSQNAIGIGMNLLDLSRRYASAQAGYNQGRALAEQLTEFWTGK